MKKSVVILALAATPLTVAMAEESKGPWDGEASLTYILNNGNTEGETLGGKAKAIHDGEEWRSTFKLEGLNQSDETGRTGEKYLGSAKLDKKLTRKGAYLFGLLEHEDDRFSGYHYQTATSLGYGEVVIDESAHKLAAEIGPGYRRSEVEEGDTLEEEAFVRGALDYKWTVSETTVFTEELSVEVGEESIISKSSTKLKTRINTHFALTLGYDIKRNNDVPEGTKNSDSTTYVTLDYTF